MCGILGFLEGRGQAAPETSTALARALAVVAELTKRTRDGGAPEELVAGLTDVGTILAALDGLAAALLLGASSDVEDELRELAGHLHALDQALTARAEAAVTFEAREGFNAAHAAALDLAWRLEHDLVVAWHALRRYREPPWDERDRPLLAGLWSVELALRGIDRLEIRGRDSIGLSVMVAFPDAEAREAFRVRHLGGPHGAELRRREGGALVSGAILGGARAGARGLAFVYKFASEVGAMGQNTRALREELARDALLFEALAGDGVTATTLAHTRWASNGIVNEVNAHPQADLHEGEAVASAGLVAVLNGDIDNYPALRAAYEARSGRQVPTGVTTDAAIIPVLVGEHLRACGNLREAFRRALVSFEGSFAIALQHVGAPDRMLLGIGGSGQSLHVGLAGPDLVVSSEVYGLVEATRRYLRLAGDEERVPGDPDTRGQIVELTVGGGVTSSAFDGVPLAADALPLRMAQITTRDIHIGGFAHFFLKEISQAVASVETTVRGALVVGERPNELRFRIDERVVPAAVLEALREGRVRQILCIGQGTAAVAAAGAAAALRAALGPTPSVLALPATEVSGHRLVPDMRDTLVLAVSQSGTTTDTNRTVDLLRARGAAVLAIVNRRNSDLVHKADGVLYTSDGRDIEMSVASTKAFYAQVAAGNLLALYLGARLGRLAPDVLQRRARELVALPAQMARVLADGENVRAVAERHMLARRHWALVGSGPNRIAAAEIRIKLSELCYKAIALDYLEDKKHIDLSSEPLVIVCAAGLDETNLADSVKEVAIFRAHRSVPLVITDAGATRFAPYAAAVIEVPRVASHLSPVLVTMVGHLLGYHAAIAIDREARALRELRAALVRTLAPPLTDETLAGGAQPEALLVFRREAATVAGRLASGALDATLDASRAARVLLLLHGLTSGATGVEPAVLPGGGRAEDRASALLNELTLAIADLTRPIDAIKHQAKTVTVGISRTEPLVAGPLGAALLDHGVEVARLPLSDQVRLAALAPLVGRVAGVTAYRLEALDAGGAPTGESRIHKVVATGVAATFPSRTEHDYAVTGTKWLALRRGEVTVARGRRDGRTIALVPLVEAGTGAGRLLLLHLTPDDAAPLAARLRFLRTRPERLDELVAAVTESGREWREELLATTPVETLLDDDPERLVAALGR